MEQIAERRNRPRLTIVEEVFDQDLGNSLGHTADLNAYGMMLIGKSAFTVGENTRISLEIPNGLNTKLRTSLTAQCRWCEPHLHTPFYNSGFRFIYNTEIDIEYMETLFFSLTN